MIVVFDLSGVVFNNGLKIAVAKISKEFNLDSQIIEFVLNGSFAEKYRTGLIEPEEFWQKTKNYLKVNDIEKIKKIFFESYNLIEETVNFLRFLREKSIKIAFLSNGPKDRTEYLDNKNGFISMFDFGLFSFEAHSWKPHIEIYEKFLEKFNLNPQELIYTDDKEKNLHPAEQLGMKTILFQNITQFRTELEKMKIIN